MDSSFSNKIDYVKEMYPKAFAKIQSTIEEECDKMDYVAVLCTTNILIKPDF